MTLSVSVGGTSDKIEIAMYRTDTGSDTEKPETLDVHNKIADILEPAIYETVRMLVKQGGIQATVKWDRQTIKLKNKSNEPEKRSAVA